MNLKFAPCNFCERKPGFHSKGINYCWKHWYSKDKDLKQEINQDKKIISKDNEEDYKKEYDILISQLINSQKKYKEEYDKLIFKIKNNKEDYREKLDILNLKLKKNNKNNLVYKSV
jgi:hypothetical protein